MSNDDMKDATKGQIIGAWIGVATMVLLIMYSDMGVMGILGTTLLVGVFSGAVIDAPSPRKANKELTQDREEEKNLKQIWSSDAGIKLSFDFWEEDKKTRTNIILKEISAYEKEYEQELKRIDKEIKEITEEIENLDKNDDDYRYDREIKKDELREAKKDRANTIRDRKDFIKEYYFAGIYQGKNQKCVFNLKDLSNFANEKGEDLSGEELAELLGSKKLCKIFEEFGFF